MGRDDDEDDQKFIERIFQSTRPVWGATRGDVFGILAAVFQSTRPVWGATRLATANLSAQIFQSTRPVWGATIISEICEWYVSKFQSTRPVWGATLAAAGVLPALAISIHAPRVGRDLAIVNAFKEFN